jgi:hypothetical protein
MEKSSHCAAWLPFRRCIYVSAQGESSSLARVSFASSVRLGPMAGTIGGSMLAIRRWVGMER